LLETRNKPYTNTLAVIKKKMTNEKYFDIVTKRFGGRANHERPILFDHFVSRYNAILEYYKRDPNLLKPFPAIIFDYVENKNFNAFAMKSENKHIIAIHNSVFLIISDLFSRMLASKNILPDIGNINLEKPTKKLLDYYSNAENLIQHTKDGKFEIVQPIDPIRKKYADHLALLAMDFIFEHELSHIVFGHVDYLNEKYGINVYSEMNSNDRQIKNNLDFQTLEMDADSTALARCCTFAHFEILNNNFLKVDSDIKFIYSDYYSAFATINFAITTVFLIFGDGNYQDIQPGKTIHPPPRMRQLMVASTFYTINEKWNLDLDLDILTKKIGSKTIEANEAYMEITGKKINKEVFEDKYYKNNKTPQILVGNWSDKLRKELIKHSYKPLAE
jgi:hypothetical protein